MGRILAHEFASLDGVFEEPSWTAAYPFAPEMGATIGALTAEADGGLLGRRTFEMFVPAWSARAAEDDPGAAFFNQLHRARRLRRQQGYDSGVVHLAYAPAWRR